MTQDMSRQMIMVMAGLTTHPDRQTDLPLVRPIMSRLAHLTTSHRVRLITSRLDRRMMCRLALLIRLCLPPGESDKDERRSSTSSVIRATVGAGIQGSTSL